MTDLIRIENIKLPLQLMTWIALLIFGILLGYYLINIGNRYVERSKRIIVDASLLKKILLGLLIFILVVLLMRKYPIIGKVLFSAVISIILAYVLNPLVDKLEKYGINRIVGVGIVYISIIVIISILLVVVIPKTTMEIGKLASALPEYAQNISNLFSDYFDNIPLIEENKVYEKISKSIDDSYNNITNELVAWITNSASKVTTFITHFVQNFINVLVSTALVLIMTFYFLIDKKKYTNRIQSWIPNSLQSDITYLSGRINTVLSEFIRGRIILAVFVGVFTAILLLVLRVDFAIVIGIITCVADIIPYIGPLLGFIPAFLFALIESPIKAIIVGVFYVLIQWAENSILAPKIIGDSMGLNPLFIFLCIVVGGGIFGVWGMVIAVPLAAVVMILIEFFINKYKESKLKEEKDGSK